MQTPDFRVLHIHTNREWGGGEYQVLHLLAGLVERGVNSCLWTPEDGALFQRARDRGLPVTPMPPNGALRALRQACCNSGPCVLHLHDSCAARLGPRAARGTGAATVYSRRIVSPVRRNWWSARKYSARRLDAVIAISNAVRDVFLQTGYPEDRLFVVPSGLDLAALEQASPLTSFREGVSSRFLVGGVGKLAPKKNWGFLLDTAAALRDSGLDIQWVVAGDGPDRATLERRAAELDLGDRVHFSGFVEDGVGVLKTLDLLFFPSIMEGASVTVRQAMALGIPVAAVDASGTAESLDGHGWLLKNGDVDGATQAVREALLDTAKRDRIRQAARASARSRFDMAGTVAGTIEVYRRARLRKEQRPTGSP